METRSHRHESYPAKKSQKLQRILLALLPFSCLVAMVANQSIAHSLNIPKIYVFFTPWLLLPIWLPLFIAHYRSIQREWDEEKREMQQRHDAEDAALFGVEIDTKHK